MLKTFSIMEVDHNKKNMNPRLIDSDHEHHQTDVFGRPDDSKGCLRLFAGVKRSRKNNSFCYNFILRAG